jgi:ubiquinone/menaquinone biosynthesis C-methylase UbiE
MSLDERKQKEAEFHDKVRDEALKEDEAEYVRLTSNKKFYSIVRKSRSFVEDWLEERCFGKRALDFCCGDGEITISLAKKGAEAFGIDISPVSVENAKKNAMAAGVGKNTKFLVQDAEKLEFPAGYFDVIICSGVLHHLDIEKAFQQISRVLKPGGEVICIEPLVYNPIFHLYRKLTPQLRTEWEAKHILSKKDIKTARKYFGDVKIRFFHLFTLAAVPFRKTPLFNFALRALEITDSIILRIPLIGWLAWQFVFILSHPHTKQEQSAGDGKIGEASSCYGVGARPKK